MLKINRILTVPYLYWMDSARAVTLLDRHRKLLQIKVINGAGRGGRTPTRLPSADFESAASASSAIPALKINSRNKRLFQTVSAAFRQYGSHQRAFNSARTSGLIVLPVSHRPC